MGHSTFPLKSGQVHSLGHGVLSTLGPSKEQALQQDGHLLQEHIRDAGVGRMRDLGSAGRNHSFCTLRKDWTSELYILQAVSLSHSQIQHSFTETSGLLMNMCQETQLYPKTLGEK